MAADRGQAERRHRRRAQVFRRGRGPTGTGKFDAGTGTVTFPITGGFVAIHPDKSYKPGYIAGNVIHQGSGLKFSEGNQSMEVTDFVVEPGTSALTATAGEKAGIPLRPWTARTSPCRCQPLTWSSWHRGQADGDGCERPELHVRWSPPPRRASRRGVVT